MIELFIALFGGLFYGGVVINEKLTKCSNSIEKSIFNHINSQVTNYSLENKMINSLVKSEQARIEMLNEIGEELEELFGKDYMDLYRNFNKFNEFWVEDRGMVDPNAIRGFTANNIWKIATLIWLSKRGIIMTELYYFFSETIRYKALESKQYLIEDKIIQILERNINKAHPELDLHLVPHKYFYDNSPCYVWSHVSKYVFRKGGKW